MRFRLLMLMLLAAAVAAPVSAQQFPDLPGEPGQPPAAAPKAKSKAKARKKAPSSEATDELTPAQIKRAQEQGPPSGPADNMPKAVKRAPRAAPAHDIACRGAFAADSGHIRLAQVFGPNNVIFSEVDGPNNTRLQASILFPNDPKRRLELLWTNNTSRIGLQVIAINGRSTWTAPRGLRVGMPIAALEKINSKPFKMTGFSAEGSSVSDWQGGALLNLPGGCKLGVRLVMDSRAPEDARNRVTGSQELDSNDAGVRAVRPTIAEILIGY